MKSLKWSSAKYKLADIEVLAWASPLTFISWTLLSQMWHYKEGIVNKKYIVKELNSITHQV